MDRKQNGISLTGFILTAIVVIIVAPLLIIFGTAAVLQFTEEPTTFDTGAAENISFTPLKNIVPGIAPGDTIPDSLKLHSSNNNLDIVKFKDRYYFSFRSAPTHFASTQTILYVLSSGDANNWEYETEFKMGADLREPRFLVFRDKLFLYCFQGGTNPLAFQPDHMYASEFVSKGEWTEPKPIYEPGYVVWRAKEHNGKAYMSVYYGVGLYTNQSEPGHLRLLESDDGYNWRMVNGKEAYSKYSAEEGEFEFDDEGNLYATIRLEMLGGGVCFAPKEDISAWECKLTEYKYDSAVMFRHGADFYVIARRNVAGKYNRSSTLLPENMRSLWYLLRYSLTRKRTALYRVDKNNLELVPIMDFPSCGDTAYAGVVKTGADKYLVYNYSSNIDGFDWSWIGGQIAGSNIYSTELEFK
ncbi:MAG TPA: hypothetical protein PLN69_08610 [bacterium]|nr:hypothetical protein [bacterium]